MAFFGFGQASPFAEADQKAQDQQAVFQGMRDNLPALGLIAGLSMLARNNGNRSVGQLVGAAGGDALNAYGTWQKMQEAKERQEMLDKERADERDYQRGQDALRNDMAERKFGLEEAKMAQDMAIARQRLRLEGARVALARQAAMQGRLDAAAKEEYERTHRTGADGNPYVMRTGEDGKTYWELDKERMIIGPNGEVLGVKQPDAAKFTDVNALGKRYMDETANYRSAGENLTNLYVGAKQANAAGDLGMVFSYMKMLDNNSVVREGEQATAQNAAGVPERIRNAYNRLLTGERLTPAQRQEFLSMGLGLFRQQEARVAKSKDYFTGVARQYGMDPSLILQEPYGGLGAEVDSYLKEAATTVPASPGAGAGTPAPRVVPGVSGAAPAAPAPRQVPGVTGRGGPGGSASPRNAGRRPDLSTFMGK